jgi:putative transposase
MARLPRLTVAGYPHHVIQRGNNRQDIVRSDADREFLLDVLSENARKHQVAFNAYVLLDNHFHLLLTPVTADGVPKMMQAVGRRYVRYFNDLHGRTGTLWEGRYKSTLVQRERYLLACMVYMDLNPVRAGVVVDPKNHPWSSHRHYIGQAPDRRISTPAEYWALGNTPFAREAAYTELVRTGQSVAEQGAITDATLHGWALGDAVFSAELEKRTPRRTTRGRAGRPPIARE